MPISCTAADLLAASKCLCGIPSGKRELVMIYLLQQLAGLGNLTAAQLLDRAKCLCGLSEHDMKAIEVALLCTATGGVPPCPPCPPSGGCTYQDMQVAWTPTNLKLGEMLGFFTFGDIASLPPSITFEQTTSVSGFDIENSTKLSSIGFPNLVSIDPTDSQGGYLFIASSALPSFSAPVLAYISGAVTIFGSSLTSISLPSLVTVKGNIFFQGSPMLTTVSMPSLVPDNGKQISINNCALNAPTVNQVLARCVANAAYVTGDIELSGGTNAAPSGQGIADKATLIGRGVTVNTN